jgi:prepilin-type N-terminal cleavage/methylation domain-containing protein
MGRPKMNSRTLRQGYTLVELLISLALLGVLFTLLGSLLTGMSKISRLAEDTSVRDREMSFCFDLIRKELGEMVVDQKKIDFNFISGDDFIAYTTTRPELLARNSIPGGARRVEWRYDPAGQRLVRSASMIVDGKRQPVEPVVTDFLAGLAGFEVYYFDKVQWMRLTGISELVPQTNCIAVRFIFNSDDDLNRQEFYESAFILPNENYVEN